MNEDLKRYLKEFSENKLLVMAYLDDTYNEEAVMAAKSILKNKGLVNPTDVQMQKAREYKERVRIEIEKEEKNIAFREAIKEGKASVLPRAWIGYLITCILILVEIIIVSYGNNKNTRLFFTTPLYILGFAYWLYCVGYIHKAVRIISPVKYPISPGEAVAYHFVPIYNFFWNFIWPRTLASFIRTQKNGKKFNANIIGSAILISFLLGRYVDPVIALATLFLCYSYILKFFKSLIEDKAQFQKATVTDNNY